MEPKCTLYMLMPYKSNNKRLSMANGRYKIFRFLCPRVLQETVTVLLACCCHMMAQNRQVATAFLKVHSATIKVHRLEQLRRRKNDKPLEIYRWHLHGQTQ